MVQRETRPEALLDAMAAYQPEADPEKCGPGRSQS